LRWHVAGVGALAIAAMLALQKYTIPADASATADMTARYAHWLIAGAALFAAGALAALWLNGTGRRLAALAALGIAGHAGGQVILLGHEALGRSNSAHYIAGQLRSLLRPGVPFYSVGMYEQTLPFYLKRTVTLVEYGDEFTFGLSQAGRR
jgi:hypothetical protein